MCPDCVLGLELDAPQIGYGLCIEGGVGSSVVPFCLVVLKMRTAWAGDQAGESPQGNGQHGRMARAALSVRRARPESNDSVPRAEGSQTVDELDYVSNPFRALGSGERRLKQQSWACLD